MSEKTGRGKTGARGAARVEAARERVNAVRMTLGNWFVGKQEIIDLMAIATVAGEPLLIVGPPGTAKSELVTKFCQAIGVPDDDYFEYMLTKFTEPSELLGPVDIAQMKEGRYIRRVDGKLPTARVAFLDEIFKSNSAILNTLLTIINERKYYQDGRPVPVNLKMIFAATNQVPEYEELAALRDRFVLKAPSDPVKDGHFDALIEKGVAAELDRSLNRRPWADLASLDDFALLKERLDAVMAGTETAKGGRRGAGGVGVWDDDEPDAAGAAAAADEAVAGGRGGSAVARDRRRWFPEELYTLFRGLLRTLEREDGVFLSDRKIVKLYRLIRTRAFLFHGGVVRKDDLVLLRYVADRADDMGPVREKVDALLRLG